VAQKRSENENDYRVISYIALRKSIGYIGVLLPIVLMFGKPVVDSICPRCGEYKGSTGQYWLESSISSYYWTSVGDVLVGSLCAIGIFLFTYRGTDERDNIAGNLACIFAAGVAFFPTTSEKIQTYTIIGTLHYVFAAGLFLTLAYFCIALFQRNDPGRPDDLKPARNRLYLTCGIVILCCIAGIAILKLLDLLGVHFPKQWALVFFFEAIAIWAFGWSWFVKGKGFGILRRK
jgi:hypothetical protein